MDWSQQADLVANIRDVYGRDGEVWLEQLPVLIRALEDEWHVTVKRVVPNLTYSFVALAGSDQDENLVLKISPVGPRADAEIAWLSKHHRGVPQLFHCDTQRGALLMERIEPGFTAKQLVREGRDDEATRAIAQVIRTLNAPSDSSFKHVSELAADLECLKGRVEDRIIELARMYFAELAADTSHDVLLHGDLHHDNVLRARDGWRAIDPHGYTGPLAFEVGAMIRNPYDCFPDTMSLKQTLERRLQILRDELPFAPQAIFGWSFAYTVLAMSWSVRDHGGVPQAHLAIIEALSRVSSF